MQKKQNPTVGKRQGFKKSGGAGNENTVNHLAGQGFCAACPYFRAVPLPSGRVRRVCVLTGEKLPAAGRLCEFSRQEEEVTA